MNKVFLTGNLGADPESFFTNDGAQIVSFDLAFKSGKDKTSWIKVSCFQKLAEIAEKYLHKGAKIAIEGALDLNKWETDDGQKRSILRMFGNSIEFMKTDGRGFEGNQKTDGRGFEGNQSQPDDDVPF